MKYSDAIYGGGEYKYRYTSGNLEVVYSENGNAYNIDTRKPPTTLIGSDVQRFRSLAAPAKQYTPVATKQNLRDTKPPLRAIITGWLLISMNTSSAIYNLMSDNIGMFFFFSALAGLCGLGMYTMSRPTSEYNEIINEYIPTEDEELMEIEREILAGLYDSDEHVNPILRKFNKVISG